LQLGLSDYEFLIAVSRTAIERFLTGRVRIAAPPNTSKQLFEKRGVFVTLKTQSPRALRGCIGRPYPVEPLVEATINSSIEAATCDPRFRPLSREEFDHTLVELSVLTRPKLVKANKPLEYPMMIEIGRDGLILERGFYRGLLLPQVAVEHGMNAEEFLSQCCLKAGIPPDAWLLDGTKVYTFQAAVAEEERPGGHVRLNNLTAVEGLRA